MRRRRRRVTQVTPELALAVSPEESPAGSDGTRMELALLLAMRHDERVSADETSSFGEISVDLSPMQAALHHRHQIEVFPGS